MIFSQHMLETARIGFEKRLGQCGRAKGEQIRARLADAPPSPDVCAAIWWLYGNSPLSDLANYDFDIFLASARHGVFLRKNSPFARELPENIFLNYVMHVRVNDEELSDCRLFFYGDLWERVRGLTVEKAVIEVNYWCAEHVCYQSADERTSSAMATFHSGSGRCGEESVFCVNAMRSVGIPARQVYTPRWAHCDDNHAWVEVWCDGRWHFLGACEPAEVLDRGWFTNAAGRAMLVHSRCFGENCGDELISKSGMVSYLNQLKRYTATRELRVTVRDEAGAPVEGATVSFGIVNYSEIFPAAVQTTDVCGVARLTCGLGSVCVHVKKDGIFCERMAYVPDVGQMEITLRQDEPGHDTWEDFMYVAPKDRLADGIKLTREQRELGQKKCAAASEKREGRTAAMFDEAMAGCVVDEFGYSRAMYDILYESRGNMRRLLQFMTEGEFSAREKEALLSTLSKKDWRDVDSEILREALRLSREYAAESGDLFFRYIACPRVCSEPLEKNRQFILDYFDEESKAAFREEPGKIWDYICKNISFDESIEYDKLITRPIGALTVKKASLLSRKILFVAICRALGVAARLNPVNRQAEYVCEGRFVPVEQEWGCSGTILFEGEGSWQYYTDFSIALLADGDYQTLDLSRENWADGVLRVVARPGDYRVITDNRLPNGNLYVGKYHFRLEDKETKRIPLRKRQADISEMLGSVAIEEFYVSDGDGRTVRGSELTRNKSVLLWLEEGMEPTEHIFNEMLERADDFGNLPADILFLVRGREALENEKLREVLAAFPGIRVFFDDFELHVETIARRVYADHEKLPLIIIADRELNVVYASGGYNVGSGEMIVKICNWI